LRDAFIDRNGNGHFDAGYRACQRSRGVQSSVCVAAGEREVRVYGVNLLTGKADLLGKFDESIVDFAITLDQDRGRSVVF
jgi:hypothetical protein